MLIARLENLQGHDETDRVKVDLKQTVPLDGWTEGVKDLNNLKEDQLWEKLGLPEKKLPFFQNWTNSDGQEWLHCKLNSHRPLKP